MLMEQLTNIFNQIKTKMFDAELDGNDDLYDELKKVRDALSSWQNNPQGDLPHRGKLASWNINVPTDLAIEVANNTITSTNGEVSDTVVGPTIVDDPLAVIIPPTPTTDTNTSTDANTDTNTDIDTTEDTNTDTDTTISSGLPDYIQRQLNDAKALFNNGRYYQASKQFNQLQEAVSGDLQQEVTRLYNESKRSLDVTVTKLIADAEAFVRNNPDNLTEQSRLWTEVLAINPDQERAKRELEQLSQSHTIQNTRQEMQDLLERAAEALKGDNLPTLNRVYGLLTALQEENQIQSLQFDLDQQVKELTQQRNELRTRLGAASTLLANENNPREAYIQARNYIDKGITTIVDTGAVMGGEAGAEVEAYQFLRAARDAFIGYLKSLSEQRLDAAQGVVAEQPEVALRYLNEAEEMLTDDILTEEDRQSLGTSLQLVEREMRDVQVKLDKFHNARQRVIDAQKPGVSPEKQLELYTEARQIYETYPLIDQYIEEAQDALAAIEAGRIQDQITLSNRQIQDDEFEAAYNTLHAAREQAIQKIPHPKSDSSLARQLTALQQQENLIVEREKAYKRMQKTLSEIDDQLSLFETERRSDILVGVQKRLDQLPIEMRQHPEVDRRQGRLMDLQGAAESWRQGQEMYRLGEWARAEELFARVINSEESSNREEAQILLYRSQAARYRQEAYQAQTKRDWRTAVSRYKEAANLFQKNGTDDYTREWYDRTREQLERLKPIAEIDQRVKLSLNQAQDLLKNAKQIANSRQNVRSKVEPIAQFQQAINILEPVKNENTTLASDISKLIDDIQETWRQTYIDALSAAGDYATDIDILELALSLGKTLEENQLLYEDSHKRIYKTIQEKYLDLVFEQLQNRPTGTPEEQLTALEENRRHRLGLADVKSETLQAQYQDAMEKRVLFEASKLSHLEGGQVAALNFLETQMIRPEMYQSEKIFYEVMHLCWQTNNWRAASQQAEEFKYRGAVAHSEQKSQVWQVLTTAAQYLIDYNVSTYEDWIKDNHAKFNGSLVLELWREQIDWVKNWHINNMLEKARILSGKSDDVDSIDAARYLSQAFQLSPTNTQVKSALSRLGERLRTSLGGFIQRAQTLKIGNSIDKTVQEGDELLFMISSLLEVQEELKLSKSLVGEMNENLTILGQKLAQWKRAKSQLVTAQREIARSLGEPDPLNLLAKTTTGGWSFASIEDIYKGIKQIGIDNVGFDKELTSLIKQRQEELNQLQKQSEELNKCVAILMTAVQNEEFDTVIEQCQTLESLWYQATQQYQFDGLERVLRHYYSHSQQEVDSINEHQEIATSQKQNLDLWRQWSEAMQTQFKMLEERMEPYMEKIRRPNKPLKEIRQELEELSQATIKFSDAFVGEIPSSTPISNAAMQYKNAVPVKWNDIVMDSEDSYFNRIEQLREKIDSDLEALAKPLRQLKDMIRRIERLLVQYEKGSGFFRRQSPFPYDAFESADRYLEDCNRLDPRNKDVLDQRKKFEKLKEKYRDKFEN